MIAAVNGRRAAWAALLLWAAPLASAAENFDGAVRELAAKTALLAGAGTPISIACRNASSLDSAYVARLRATFENLLRQAGGHAGQSAAAVEVSLTLSENATIICWWKKRAKATSAWCGSPPGSARPRDNRR